MDPEAQAQPDVRITVGRREAATTAMLAHRHRMDDASMRKALKRLRDENKLVPAAYVDGRTPLYLIADANRALGGRPRAGKGEDRPP